MNIMPLDQSPQSHQSSQIRINKRNEQKNQASPLIEKLPAAECIITDPAVVVQVMHTKKQLILQEIFHEALTIQELRKRTGLNPGTIKRHLDDLILHQLVFVEREERNTYNILMKFYRTTAEKFIINFQLPDDFQHKRKGR